MVDTPKNLGFGDEGSFFDEEATLIAQRVVPISHAPPFTSILEEPKTQEQARASLLMVACVVLGASGLGVFVGLVTSSSLLNHSASETGASVHAAGSPNSTSSPVSLAALPAIPSNPKQDSGSDPKSSKPPKSMTAKTNPDTAVSNRKMVLRARRNGAIKDSDADWEGAKDQKAEPRGGRGNSTRRPGAVVLHAVRRQFVRFKNILIGRQ